MDQSPSIHQITQKLAYQNKSSEIKQGDFYGCKGYLAEIILFKAKLFFLFQN